MSGDSLDPALCYEGWWTKHTLSIDTSRSGIAVAKADISISTKFEACKRYHDLDIGPFGALI